jgi:hypothetical protein
LAEDLPRLWKDPEIEDRDRKRMIRLLLEDVTMIRGDQISLHLRFRGGASKSVTLPNPLRAWQIGVTDAEAVTRIDQLLDTMTFGAIAATLNSEGYKPGRGKRFTARYIARIQREHALRSRFDRLRALGMLTLQEMAQALSVNPKTVKIWAAHGLVTAYPYTDKPEYLYKLSGSDAPRKAQGRKLSMRRPIVAVVPERPREVQCEA